MPRRRQSALEKELVRVAYGVVKRDWPVENRGPFSNAAVGELATGRRESTNVSRWVRDGKLPQVSACKSIGKVSPDAGMLFLGWIPALRVESSMGALNDPFSRALEALGIPTREIQHTVASPAPKWPYCYRSTVGPPPLALFCVDLINCRRLFSAGPIYLAREQAWCTALSLLEAVCAVPALGPIAPRIWTRILKNFVPERDAMVRFGELEDVTENYYGTPLPREVREFRYEALANCVDAILIRGEDPSWMPMRAKHELQAVVMAINSEIASLTQTARPVRAQIHCDVAADGHLG